MKWPFFQKFIVWTFFWRVRFIVWTFYFLKSSYYELSTFLKVHSMNLTFQKKVHSMNFLEVHTMKFFASLMYTSQEEWAEWWELWNCQCVNADVSSRIRDPPSTQKTRRVMGRESPNLGNWLNCLFLDFTCALVAEVHILVGLDFLI